MKVTCVQLQQQKDKKTQTWRQIETHVGHKKTYRQGDDDTHKDKENMKKKRQIGIKLNFFSTLDFSLDMLM